MSAGPALAGVGLGVTPEFPAKVTVGDTDVPAGIRIANAAFGGEADNSATLTDITVVPSCALSPAAPPDTNCTGGEDRGALRLSASGTGVADSACEGRTFTITEIDQTSGRYRLTPDAPVVLGPPDSATDTCLIDFTFDVARMPAKDAFPDQSGLQTTQVGFSAATFSPSSLTGSGSGTDVTTVAKAVPTLTTEAPPTSTVGQPVSDVATLSGGVGPGGEITFTLFGPDDAECVGPPVFTSTRPVDGDGQYTSEAFTPTAPGTYRWVAAYSGDDANDAVTTACGEANEITEVAAVLGAPA
ncbi:MAG TPA: hypothetical protein VHF25_15420, partial [Nitriliruptorales bacterium]|nr:hypothetical protein [Nitriliruptorales bacterium]